MEICLNATNSGAADGCFADYASMGGFDPAAPGQPASVGVKGVMKSWNVRIPRTGEGLQLSDASSAVARTR